MVKESDRIQSALDIVEFERVVARLDIGNFKSGTFHKGIGIHLKVGARIMDYDGLDDGECVNGTASGVFGIHHEAHIYAS